MSHGRAQAGLAAALVLLLSGCAATEVRVSPNAGVLAEEVARMPAADRIAHDVAVQVHAPEQMDVRGGGRRSTLKIPANRMLMEAAHAVMRRWFQGEGTGARPTIKASLLGLKWWQAPDMGKQQAVVEAELSVCVAHGDPDPFCVRVYSGRQRGEMVKVGAWSSYDEDLARLHYDRVIYRAFLVALDKAMADIAARIEEQEKAGAGAGQGR